MAGLVSTAQSAQASGSTGKRHRRQAAAQLSGRLRQWQPPRCDVLDVMSRLASPQQQLLNSQYVLGRNWKAMPKAPTVALLEGQVKSSLQRMVEMKGGTVEQHRTGRRGQGWAAHAACTVAGNASTGLGSSSARSHTRQSLQEAIPSQLPAQPHSLVAAYACEAAGGTCAEQHRNHCVPGGAAAAGGGCHARLITGEPPAVSDVQAASEHGPRVRRTAVLAQHAAEPQAGRPAATRTCRPKAVRPVGCSSCVLLKLCWMRFELPAAPT